MTWPFALAAFFAGWLVPYQTGMNTELRRHLGAATGASFVNCLVATIAMAAVTLALAPRALSGGAFRSAYAGAPWWAWMGGLLGGTFVTLAIVAAPKLGTAALLVAIVAGQMTSSLIVDHWGMLNLPTHPVTPGRVAGVLLVLAGVLLIQRT